MMSAIFTIGIFLSIFLSLLLVAKRNKSLPDVILAIWLAIIGIHLSSYYLYSLDFWAQYPHLIGVTAPLPLLHGPMLLIYTLYSLRSEKRLRKIDYLHFAPAGLTWLYLFKFYFFYTPEQKIMVDQGVVNDFAVFSVMMIIAFVLSGLIYPVIAFRLIRKHTQLVDDNFSYDHDISLTWLKYCIYGTGVLYGVVAVIYFLKDGMGLSFDFDLDLIIYGIIVLYVVSIGYFGIRQESIFSDEGNELSPELIQPKGDGEYKKSGLKTDIALDIHARLLKLMDQEKPHTDPKLTLRSLAAKLKASPNHVSQVINQYEKMNFHDFVNRYRVEQFIANASSNKHFSILARALDAGFNSKSSFNSVFKKHKGLTPSRFLESLK